MKPVFEQPTASTIDTARRAFWKHESLHTLAHYTGILALHGLARLAVTSKDRGLVDVCYSRFEPFVAGKIKFPCNFLNYQCGGNGAALLLWKGLLPDAAEPCRLYAEQLVNDAPRDPNGLFRMPGEDEGKIWIDTAFAVTPFLLFTGLALKQDKYVEEAIFQAIGLTETLLDPATGLCHQSRGFVGEWQTSKDHWSRGNGWALLALAELAAWLPKTDDRRPAVDRVFVNLLNACLKYQDADGMWHQEITIHDQSYVETSGTGLILFALGVALERGLVSPDLGSNLIKGLNSYARYISSDGSVFHTCRGCLSPGDGSIKNYLATPPVLNDPHAFGPVVLAFGQASKLGIETVPASFSAERKL